MIAAIHLVAHILFVLALVASAAALIHTNDTSYFCGSHWPSHEHGLTPSHTCLPAAGVLSLIVVLSARALRRAVSTSTMPEICAVHTMLLVASRFHAWIKPIMFHKNWMQRISNCLLPNANFIRILVLDMPFAQGKERDRLPAEEQSLIWKLLEASGRVRYLAVTWNIRAHLERECGALRLESLYLIWDVVHNIDPPSLHHLQHPATLKDLAIYAPGDVHYSDEWQTFGKNYLPATIQCANLAYVSYEAYSIPRPIRRGRLLDEADQRKISKLFHSVHPVPQSEWVAKMEGRESLLCHPAKTAAADSD
ncbi:hypothetical protein B0H11DRAFT_2211870 [Mycena galericulata]|nr:hypothetical protein B0H11DRAFT_2211870 [Mycena galericulata]